MTPEGQVDLEATQRSIERLIANGVSGLIVLPMLGENASLTVDERERVIRGATDVVRARVPLLSGLAETTLDAPRAHARRKCRAVWSGGPHGISESRLQN